MTSLTPGSKNNRKRGPKTEMIPLICDNLELDITEVSPKMTS